MTNKPLDCTAPKDNMGKHDFINFDDKEHKIDKTRLNKGETITKSYVVILKDIPCD
jgi:hypothetical protein